MNKTNNSALKWGILGTGHIAHKFCEDLKLSNQTLAAVGSRTKEKARSFADTHYISEAHGSYQALIHDPAVDIIYVATPHHNHFDWAMECIKQKKSVLIEKPITVNAEQCMQLIKAQNEHKVFVMEAMWTRFNPVIQKMLEWLGQEYIGRVISIQADFAAFRKGDLPNDRLTTPQLAGGSLLDLGVYPLALSHMIMGTPSKILATSIDHPNGIDLQTSIVLGFTHATAMLQSSFQYNSKQEAYIYGTEGHITISNPWYNAEKATLISKEKIEDFQINKKGHGYTHEIEACIYAYQHQLNNHPSWQLSDSLAVLKVMDEVRSQIGLIYPFE